VVEGQVAFDEAWGLPTLGPGQTALVPASLPPQSLRTVGNGGVKLLRVTLG